MTSWSQPTEFDAVYETSPGKTPPPPNLSALYPTLQPLLSSGQKIHMNRFYQVPSFLWASQQLGKLIPNTVTDAESAAQFYLNLFSPLYGLKPKDLTAAEVRLVHDTGRGGIIVKYRQAIEDIEVFRNEMSFLMDRQLNLTAISGHLAPLSDAILNNPSAEFLIQEEQAASDAIQDFTSVRISPEDFSRKTKNGRYTSLYLNNETKKTMSSPPSLPIRSKKVFYQMPNELIPAYYLELKTENQTTQSTSYYSYVIHARTGQVLFRHNLENDVAYDQHDQCDGIHSPENLQATPDPDGHHYIYRVWADTGVNPFPHYGPTGRNGMPHPTSDPDDGFIPEFIQPTLIELAHGPISTQDPWLPIGAIETRGNNVDAYLDLNFPDGFSEGDFRPSITGRNSFTHQYDPGLDPYSNPSQQMAAGTMAFYTINFMHDWFYDNGFSEESGNSQSDNFGRGGFDGDPILVEIQNFEAINNASMFTPADGGSPTMRLHIFNAPLNSFEIGVFVETPNDLSGGFESNLADFGPQSFDINGEIRLLDDGTDPTADACEPIINADELKGNIALIDRGVCFFSDKTLAAQEAGAIGVIIVNNVEGIPPGMTGDTQGIVIPVLSISINDGNRIKEALDQGETVITRMVRDTVVDRDGALDNAIVIHEWAHHMSQRLIADAAGLSNNQGASLSEGWSDFTALLSGVQEADRNKEGNELFQAAYPPPGAYVLNNPYFGIRRYPFSTQLSINPSTFGMIEDSASLPIMVPQNPTLVGVANSEIHTAGFVWANMLWECYASLLNDSGRPFPEAQETMKDYLVASLKMTPPTPTFTEARDALLAVTLAGNRRDFERFNEAFAKRGMGKDAQSPSRESIDHSGVIENFDSGVILIGSLSLTGADLVDSVSNCDNDGILDSGETGTLRIALTNDGIIPLTQTTGILFSRHNELSIADAGIITFPPSNVGETVYGEIQVSFVSDQSDFPLEFTIQISDEAVPEFEETLSFIGNRNRLIRNSSVDDVESGMLPEWIRASDVGTGARWRIDEDEEGNHAWFGPGAEGNTDNSLVTPPMRVSEETFFGFSFRHRYDFENGGYDGAVVELTFDGGQSWIDIGQFSETGYNLELIEGPNPLTLRQAYGDTSENYPEFLNESFNLGSRFAGRIVQVRFRVGTDPFVFNTGWHIDDMEFHGIVSPPFSAFEGDITQCVPLPKINVVTHQDLETDESGRQSVFEIDLNQAPSTDVFISLSTDLPNEGIVEPKILVFTPGNWNLPKTITLTGIDDPLQDGQKEYRILFEPSVSGDENYQGIKLPTLTAVNHDDETAFMVIIEPQAGLKTSESGGKAIVSVSLNQPPNQTLVISFQSSDETEGVVQPTSLRFTPQNFDTIQEITITGIDDLLKDGNIPYRISTELSPKAALPSSALSGELFVTNEDNDSGDTISFKVTPNRLESTLPPNETISLPLLVTPSAPGPTNFELSIEDGAEENAADTWITVTPLSWTAASGEQQVVLVELNSNNRSEGHLSATITIVNVNSPESRQSVQVSLDITNPCPSGLSDSLQIGPAQIGGFASLALVAENTLFFEVEYQSKVTQVFPNKDLQFPFPNLGIPKNGVVAGFQLGPVTADSPTAIIRAFGQNRLGEQCFESLEIDIEYAEASIVAVRVLNEDGSTAPKTVPAETKLVIEIETEGASLVSLGERTMISDLNPNSNFRNTWTLLLTPNENLVLPITLKTPGNPPIMSMDPDFPELTIQVDLPPETVDDFLTTDEDSVLTINVITDLLANDIDRNSDSEGPLRFITLVLNSNRGILMDNGDGTWQFDPNQDFETLTSSGRETINLSYLIENAAGQSTKGNLHLEILGINDKPIVADDFFTLANSEELLLDILANDSDLDGELEILPLTDETKGEVDIDPSGMIRYVPHTFFGIDSFTYSVSDGDGGFGSARVIILIEKELLPEETSPLAAAADFNRDGQADILLQDAQGNLLLWLMEDGQVAHESGFFPSMLPDDNWKIAAIADFNQDGFPDLVLQHPKDFLALWTLAGTTVIKSDFLVPFRTGTPSWHLAAAADFDGDETPDLVFQHLSGDLALWEMENNRRVEAKFFTPRRIENRDWRVVGAADFNSDGKNDLLVRHVDGWIGVWFMNDTQFVAGTFLNPKRISLDWKTTGVSDYNSDNQPDILFQSEEGEVLIWIMDGVNLLESNEVDLLSPNPDFQIVGPK